MNAQRLTISAIIPTYNCAKYVGEAIESLLTQTYSVSEIVVVDDGSSDNTEEVARSFGDRIIYIRQANQGQSVARNQGLEIVKGDFVALLDADDVSPKHRLEKQIVLLIENPEAVACFTGYWSFGPEGISKEYWADRNGGVADSLSFLTGCRVLGASVVFHRLKCLGLRYPVGVNSGEDPIFCALLRTRGEFIVVPEPLYGYRTRPGQASCRYTEMENFEQRLKWVRAHWAEYWPGMGLAEVERRMWLGLAETLGSFYWVRQRQKFLDVRSYLRKNWPRHLQPAKECSLRWYPDWLWACKGWLDQLRGQQVSKKNQNTPAQFQSTNGG